MWEELETGSAAAFGGIGLLGYWKV
jgi:hypothetical protein